MTPIDSNDAKFITVRTTKSYKKPGSQAHGHVMVRAIFPHDKLRVLRHQESIISQIIHSTMEDVTALEFTSNISYGNGRRRSSFMKILYDLVYETIDDAENAAAFLRNQLEMKSVQEFNERYPMP